jgi:diguanylate cyclase (GGDEF)-like protein/PAS domain S-box-containing protein
LRRILIACCLLLSTLCPAARALEPVTLQLKWSHAFQFAGYYAAREQGYYAAAGLDVRILPGNSGDDVVQHVLDGRANYGVGNSSLLLARKAGKPVVALAVIFQHSPAVLLVNNKAIPNGPSDLRGKRIMVESQLDDSLAYLRQLGIGADAITQVPHSLNPADLMAGKVDAITAYSTFEPYFLDQAGFKYTMLTPLSAGIDFYGDNLFTSEQELRDHPQRTRAFREASLRGWQYAIAHPREIAELIRRNYAGQYSLDFYLHEAAAMQPLLRSDLIEVGYMNPVRWLHIADTYADLGMLPRGYSLTGFLYQPHPQQDLGWLYLTAVALGVTGAIALYIYRVNRQLARALDASHQAAQALRISEERHRLLADHASDLIWTMDLKGHFTYISPSIEKLLGYTPAEAMTHRLADNLCPGSSEVALAALSQLVLAIRQGQPAPAWRGELEHPHKHGGTVWTESTISALRDASGQAIALLGLTRDIGERRRADQQMRHMAQHDMLTGLPNRALFSDRLQQALTCARRDGDKLALLFIDLDKFKPVNDKLGHQAGDLLLQQAAQRMYACVRESDSVARIGGDEFVVLLRAVDSLDGALAAGEKLCQALRPEFRILGHNVHISASIGIAVWPDHGDDEISLSQHADSAMYAAKESGSDRAHLFRFEQ